MSEKSINTLFELLDLYRIEIPIVQRDYAQGRNDEHAKLVRTNLLKDMKAAILQETLPLDLNFVYGKAEDQVFIPIDGQQRLTTLFLLYLYACRDDSSKTNLLKRFTYKTRKSSRDFLEKLVEYRSDVFKSNLLPSKEIEEAEWFVSMWKYDPTIQSVFTILNDIKSTFENVQDLPLRLLEQEYKPIVFNFLDINDLGMEDSLYIKLNARGKPLSSFENFKARLIDRMQKSNSIFKDEFEKDFDGIWTDLFWAHNKECFDVTYLNFFGVLLMNKGICKNDANWSDTLAFEKIEEEVFETIFYSLNYLAHNPDKIQVNNFIFNSLKEKCTYKERILFHAVTTYLYQSKGISYPSMEQWLRIIKNLTLNSQIDTDDLYRNAIKEINKLAVHWDDLIDYFANGGDVAGFSKEQIKEERKKAQIILKDKQFADAIYESEKHSYFSGQIRSALYYAINNKEEYDLKVFEDYWTKITLLFDGTKPKYGNLLRQALLTFGDYTISVGEYKTLCIDDPNEASSTPSLKRLFSNNNQEVKQLLDVLDINKDIEEQLRAIINNSTIPQNDWRYCLIHFPQIFSKMSNSHLRLRKVEHEFIVIPNKSSSGFNYGLYLCALQNHLDIEHIENTFGGECGATGKRYIEVKNLEVCFSNGEYTAKSKEGSTVVFKTHTSKPIEEILQYLIKA